jgi:hypothetical protein
MGGMLDKPNVEKETDRGEGKLADGTPYSYGASAMYERTAHVICFCRCFFFFFLLLLFSALPHHRPLRLHLDPLASALDLRLHLRLDLDRGRDRDLELGLGLLASA